jgi:hypothetical protein
MHGLHEHGNTGAMRIRKLHSALQCLGLSISWDMDQKWVKERVQVCDWAQEHGRGQVQRQRQGRGLGKKRVQ